MKFLDERITFQVQVGTRVQDLPEKGIYTYAVLKTDSDGYEETIFIGNFYYDKKFNHIIDVTDIIRNSTPTYKNLERDLHNPYGLSLSDGYGWVMDEYWIELRMVKDGSPLVKTSEHELVANVYRYPNRSKYAILDGTSQFYNYHLSAFQNRYDLLLQGWQYNQYMKETYDRYALIPKYPCRTTGNYAWSTTFGHGTNVAEINLWLADETGYYDEVVSLNCQTQGAPRYNNIWVSSLGSLLEDYMYDVEEHGLPFGNLYMGYTNSLNQRIRICEFEACYSRYYLQWLDRFGCVQSQPFRENITYSEDFNNEEIVTYEDKRRVSHINVQPKWKLYSGWIKDRLYPYYESIFTSPFLILYDSETNMNYEVIVTDNKYTEKNYNNQKGLINIELNLEAAEKQNMIY